nr:cytochrome P450 monooxygenase NecE [Nectria sp. HLS206]
MYASEIIDRVKSYGPNRYVVMIELVVLSLTFAYLHALAADFLQTFLKKPKHFATVTWKDRLFKPRASVPVVKVEKGNYDAALAAGSKQYPDRAYKIKHFSDEIVIIPQKDIDRIKAAPESKLSFQQASYDFFMGQFTGITGHDQAMSTLIRRDIARLVDRVYDIVEDEAAQAVDTEIGPCEDWTPIVLLPKIVRIIIDISQRVFVGDSLCRNEKWIKTITECTAGAFQSVPVLWQYGWITRPFAAWRMPALRKIRQHREEAKELLKPVIDKRLADMEKPDFKPPPDLIQLVLDGTKGKGRSLDYQINAQIGTGRASLFTTGVTISHLMYDLTTHPEFIEPLREEVLSLGNVKMNRANVAKLEKMDSFIRECQRWNKFLLVGTIRKVLKPLELSDGTVLPKGALLGLNTHDAVFKYTTLDDPEVFDGLRFYKLRSQPGSENKFQAVAPGPDHLVFGYGPQACPGRFFAVHEAKVVLSRILSRYEFKLRKPVDSPMARAIGIMTQADASVEYLFKRLEKSTA